MKIQWEESDIQVGMVVLSPSLNEPWMVTYKDGAEGQTYGFVSLLDGMEARDRLTKAGLVIHLNACESVPSQLHSDIYGGLLGHDSKIIVPARQK